MSEWLNELGKVHDGRQLHTICHSVCDEAMEVDSMCRRTRVWRMDDDVGGGGGGGGWLDDGGW